MLKRNLVVASAVVVLALTGCAKDDTEQTRSTMTEREKDSLIARSPIPGAKAVQKSMNAADSASARANRQTAIDTTP